MRENFAMKNKTKAMSPQKNKIKTIKKKISPFKKSLSSKISKETTKNKPGLKDSAALRKRAEEAAKKASREWQATFDAVNDAICLLDVDNHIMRCNRTMNENFGITQEELIGKHCWEIVHGTTEPIPDCPVIKIKSSLQREEMEIQIKGKWLNIIAYPILDDSRALIAIVHIIRNITERKQAEEKLRNDQQELHAIMNASPIAVSWGDMQGNIKYTNRKFQEIFGYTIEDIPNIDAWLLLAYPSIAYREHVLSLMSSFIETQAQGKDVNPLELTVVCKNGSIRHVSQTMLFTSNRILAIYYDITERMGAEAALRESEIKYRTLFESASDTIFLMDNDTFIDCNQKALEMFGCTREQIIGKSPYRFSPEIQPDGRISAERALEKINAAIKGQPQFFEWQHSRYDGTCFDTEISLNAFNVKGKKYYIQAIVRDVTDRKRVEEALRESEQKYQGLSIIDDLTQLYNSRHFHVQLEKEIERSNRYEQPLTLILLDLDNFKEFNDTYGHVEGDYVLLRLGQVIKRCLRETDSAYRYGGEEFTIMLPMTTSGEGIVTAKRIQKELRKEAFSPVLGEEVYITVSIGVAQYKSKEVMKEFVQRVDQLMYQAKKKGRDNVCHES
jgi:diguanylate cyclase (GGDEF)-like protein/PAS domain S-box-containing protein